MKKTKLINSLLFITTIIGAMEKETPIKKNVHTDFFASLPNELHKEFIVNLLETSPNAIENLETLQKLMLTSKKRAELKNLFKDGRNIIEFGFALKRSTGNIFRSLDLLKEYNFITQDQYNHIKERYQDEFQAYQADKELIAKLLNPDTKPNLEEVKKLIESGIDINIQNQFGQTPLIVATRNNNIQLVEILISSPTIDPNIKDRQDFVALNYAIRKNASPENIRLVKLLLSIPGIDINSTDSIGTTILMDAVIVGTPEIVKLLLAVPNINVNAQNNVKMTALMYAARDGKTESAKLLLAMPNIKVNPHDGEGNTALILAVERGHAEIAKLLLDVPTIEVNATNSKRNTALIEAIDHERIEIAKLLLARNDIKVNVHGYNGNTALILATKKQLKEIVQILLSLPKIEVNAINNKGNTALMEAATLMHEEKSLRSSGFRVTLKYTEIARFLLNYPGINVHIKNFKGKTALELAPKFSEIQNLIRDFIEKNKEK